MTYLTGEVTVIHDLNEVNFSAFTYSKVQANVGASYTINGTSVEIAEGSTLEVIVHEEGTILSADYVLLGNPVPPQTQYKTGLLSTTIGNFQNNNTGIVETFQFVNIKNGNPTQSTG